MTELKKFIISVVVCAVILLIAFVLKKFSEEALNLYLAFLLYISINSICNFVVSKFTKKGDK